MGRKLIFKILYSILFLNTPILKFKKSIIFLLCFISYYGFSQRIHSIVFNKLPQNYQFYARSNSNKAKVSIRGVVESPSMSYMSVITTKEGRAFHYDKAKFNYVTESSTSGNFSLEVEIQAELAEYEMKIYAVRSTTDSALIVTRTNIVAGDAYLVSGQSNSYNGWEFPDSYKGKYSRSFGRFNSTYENYDTYQASDTLWSIANAQSPVGKWPGELMKLIIENQKIPVCILSGGSGSSSMEYNLLRNTNNPFDFNTSSGKLLYRATKSGLVNSFKAFIYRQGENDANGYAATWKSQFLQYVDLVKGEYPSIKKLYLPQINVINGFVIGQGILRNDQRILTSKDGFIKGFATVGTQGHDGVHYSAVGHEQSALELYRILAEDFYSSPSNPLVYSPNVVSSFYLNESKTKIALEFEKGQLMHAPKDTLLKTRTGDNVLKKPFESFYFSNVGWPIESSNSDYIKKIVGVGNYLVLELDKAPPVDKLTYLPVYSSDKSAIFPFAGPYIVNSKGMRAFSFENVSIRAFNGLDADSDGILNSKDSCANTKFGNKVNLLGCSVDQIDTDKDGVIDSLDICSNTKLGNKVNLSGCSLDQLDTDQDGIFDDKDDCPTAINPKRPVILKKSETELGIDISPAIQWFLNEGDIKNATLNTLKIYQSGNYSVQVKDVNGCSSQISAQLTMVITGIKEEQRVQLYPNPVKTQVKIEFDDSFGDEIDLSVYNSVGQWQFSKSHVKNKEMLNLQFLPPGGYVIYMNSILSPVHRTFKLIKE